MKVQIRSVEVVEEDGREVVLLGIPATEESKQLARDILGEEVQIHKPVDEARLIYLWESDRFSALVKYLKHL